MHVAWDFHPASVGDPDGEFTASPTVYKNKVFDGNLNGRFYALDASTGALVWKYPATGQPLLSQFICNDSGPGIASSAAIARLWVHWFWLFKRPVTAVIFGAPDPSTCLGSPATCGSGRLWALDVESGALIWKSDIVATLNGSTQITNPPPGFTELHERIGYSSPVVHRDKVYVGVSDSCDSPIQRGRLVAVDLHTGGLIPGFAFDSSGPPRGGGMWSSPVVDHDRIFVTTGNPCTPSDGGCATEPASDYANSMLRLDISSGAIFWAFQPLPWSQDQDTDWAATAAVGKTTCGTLVVGTMKDGWTHALDASTGAHRWTFPYAPVLPFNTPHFGDDYNKPVAIWRDEIFAVTGGFPVNNPGTSTDGYDRLYALDACTPYVPSDNGRVRWIADVPGVVYRGQPTVTNGIVYVGTDAGQFYAIADPSVAPPVGQICNNPLVPNPLCSLFGGQLVSQPKILAKVPLTGGIRTEAVLARGKVYVGTDAGHLYSLAP